MFGHIFYRVFKDSSPTQMEVTRRKTYDGREISFVTLNTQTDWDWVSEVETGTARTVDSDSKLLFGIFQLIFILRIFKV